MKLRNLGYKSVSDRQDALQLRRILNEDDLPSDELVTIWKAAFPAIAIWSLPEIEEWLTNVFLFSPLEVDNLIHIYKNQIHVKIKSNKTMSDLPKFKKDDPNLNKINKNYREIFSMMIAAEKLLNESTSLHYYYDTRENYEKAAIEKDHLKNLFLEIRQYADRHANNCERHINGET